LMHQAAEYLAMVYLLRRNILAYKAPPNNEGYDLICIHPNPRKRSNVIRVQVKSRYQTDGNRSVFIKEGTFAAFDFLVIALLNIGYYYGKHDDPVDGLEEVEFITLPRRVARRWYKSSASGMNRVLTRGRRLDKYLNEEGFELIAKALKIDYPGA
jgi:hypothetical protein